jgi:hypothetical protein
MVDGLLLFGMMGFGIESVPPAAKTLFEKRVLESQKLSIKFDFVLSEAV